MDRHAQITGTFTAKLFATAMLLALVAMMTVGCEHVDTNVHCGEDVPTLTGNRLPEPVTLDSRTTRPDGLIVYERVIEHVCVQNGSRIKVYVHLKRFSTNTPGILPMWLEK